MTDRIADSSDVNGASVVVNENNVAFVIRSIEVITTAMQALRSQVPHGILTEIGRGVGIDEFVVNLDCTCPKVVVRAGISGMRILRHPHLHVVPFAEIPNLGANGDPSAVLNAGATGIQDKWNRRVTLVVRI